MRNHGIRRTKKKNFFISVSQKQRKKVSILKAMAKEKLDTVLAWLHGGNVPSQERKQYF